MRVNPGSIVDQLQQQRGGGLVVLRIKGGQQPKDELAQLPIEHPNRAEIQQSELPVLAEHHVARMEVGVEHTHHEHLSQDGLQQVAGQRRARLLIQLGKASARAAESDAVDHLHHDHAFGAQLRKHRRNAHRGARCRPEQLGVGQLEAVVQLLEQSLAESGSKRGHAHIARPLRAGFGPGPQAPHDVNIDGHALARTRPLHLDHHRRAVLEHGAVHLSN